MTLLSYSKRRKFLIIFILLFILFILIFSANSALAYSLDDPPGSLDKTTKSIFNQNLFQFSPIDITKFIKKDSSGLSFNDLVNTESFSLNDVGASAKALLILFVRLIVVTLNVTLGILNVLLEILTKQI